MTGKAKETLMTTDAEAPMRQAGKRTALEFLRDLRSLTLEHGYPTFGLGAEIDDLLALAPIPPTQGATCKRCKGSGKIQVMTYNPDTRKVDTACPLCNGTGAVIPDHVAGQVQNSGHHTAEQIAERFHETYERLAPSFGYTTRPETRKFDPTSPNGKLMIAVCGELLRSLQIPEEPTGWRPISFQDVMESEGSIVMLHPGTKAVAFYIADGIHACFTLPPLDRAMLRAGKT